MKLRNLTKIILILFISCAVLLNTGCMVSEPDITPVETENTTKTPEEVSPTETPEVSNSEELTEPEEPTIEDNLIDWTEVTHGNSVDPNYDVVFNQSEVLEFNIVISSDNWELMQNDLNSNLSGDSDPIWVTSTITFNDMVWNNVGIRYKGNSSLKSVARSDNNKFSFKLDFDEFEDQYPEIDNQRFYGFKQLNLNNNFSDESMMHDKLAADLFSEFGVPAAQTAFCIVNVDYGEGSQFFGVYTLIEEMDDTGIENQFGDDSGNLYKPEGKGSTFAAGSYNNEDMYKKNNEDVSDYSDIRSLHEIINSNERVNDYSSWKDSLENIFNVDGFLKWLAVNTVIQNWDTYGISPHNYYLYNDPGTNLLNWIPWDNNEAFVEGKKEKSALSLGMDEVSDKWPLIHYLIDDANYKAIYDEYVERFTSEVFIPDKMIVTINTYYEMIKNYAYAEETGFTFLKSDKAFDLAVEELKTHVMNRNTAVLNYLGE